MQNNDEDNSIAVPGLSGHCYDYVWIENGKVMISNNNEGRRLNRNEINEFIDYANSILNIMKIGQAALRPSALRHKKSNK